MKIGDKKIGPKEPCYIVAEIGINHNGDIETAEKLIDAAMEAEADAVKFQKRTPEICTPKDYWYRERETPWGRMDYIDYRKKLELKWDDYDYISFYCENRIDWFASVWDIPSVDFMEEFDPVCYKIPSAMLTNHDLLEAVAFTGRPVIMSTGGSAISDIWNACSVFGKHYPLALMQCTACYPCVDSDLNLEVIRTLKEHFPNIPIGYSGHELGLATTVAAVALGAKVVERHITLDRAGWGSDQSASIEPHGFKRMVKYIRNVEEAMGNGKQVLEIEEKALKKLRWHEQ